MKRKLVFFFIAFFVCVCIVISVICVLNSLIVLATLSLFFAVVVVFSLVCVTLYRKFMRNRIIDPKIDLKRNYERIMLGEMSKQETVTDNTLDLRGFHRNAYTDILLTERYYSFLKQNGCVDIFAFNSDYYLNSHRINQIDYPLLHPVTLLEHGISKYTYRFALLNPIFGLMYIFYRIFNKRNKMTVHPYSVDIFEPLVSFCKERNIKIVIHSKNKYES